MNTIKDQITKEHITMEQIDKAYKYFEFYKNHRAAQILNHAKDLYTLYTMLGDDDTAPL